VSTPGSHRSVPNRQYFFPLSPRQNKPTSKGICVVIGVTHAGVFATTSSENKKSTLIIQAQTRLMEAIVTYAAASSAVAGGAGATFIDIISWLSARSPVEAEAPKWYLEKCTFHIAHILMHCTLHIGCTFHDQVSRCYHTKHESYSK
jgi:hypothetical protein